MSRRFALLVAGALLATAAPASAEPAVGILAAAPNTVVTFDTASPGSFLTSRPVVGLGANEQLVGIDYRYVPGAGAEPSLVGVTASDGGGGTDTLRTYSIDPSTGAATALRAATATFDHGTTYGIDINHAVDRIRVVNDAEKNGRVHPATGARVDTPGNDTDLSPAVDVTAIAYDRVDSDAATPTTLYGLSRGQGSLVMIGGVNGTPSSNGGVVTTVGSLGLGAPASLAFDISPSGIAYAGADTTFATVNLSTGAATPVGAMPSALRSLAIVPAATLTIGPAAQTRSEAAGPATLTVTRGGDMNYWVSIGFAASDGLASGRLVFAPGETTQTVTVPVVNDTVRTGDRTVTYSLSRADGLTSLGGPATLTITDDDPAADKTAPKATIKAPPSTTLKSFTSKGVKATIAVSEAAKLEVSLEGTPKTAVLSAAYGLTLATKSLNAGGTKSVTLKPSKKLVGKPKRAFKVRVKVVATDAAGNRSTATRTLTVKK